MNWRPYLRRATPATLIVGICLFASACVSTGSRSVPPTSSGKSECDGLTASESRKVEALAHFASGVSLEARNALEAALPEYARAYELDPQQSVLAYRVAQIYASQKNFTNAVAILEDVIHNDPQSPDPWFWLGVIYRSSDQTSDAVNAFQRALKLDNGQLIALQNLLEIHIQQPKAAQDAFKWLERARQYPAMNWQYWVRLGDLYASILKQKPSLISTVGNSNIRHCYEKAHALAPDEPDVLSRLGAVYEEADDYAKAAHCYARLQELQPDLPQVRERLAYAYVRSDQATKAVAIYSSLIKQDPLRYDVYNSLAGLYEELDKDNDAILAYQQSLAVNPHQLAPTLRIALLQMKLKQHDEALKTLLAAKEKYPAAFQVPYFMALVYSDQKQFEKSMAAFADAQMLAEAAPDSLKFEASFYFYYGTACERAGNLDKAASLFRRAIELAPGQPDAYNYLGYMWADKGIHLEESLELIKKAVAIEPNNPAYLDSIGWVLFKLNRPAEALPHLLRAIDLMSKDKSAAKQEDATILGHLADVYSALGKKQEAIAALRRALKAEPENKTVAEKLRELTGTTGP